MANKQKTYTEIKKELEVIMSQLQSDDIEVDAALALHEQAEALILELEKYLEAAENVIEQRTATANKETEKDTGK